MDQLHREIRRLNLLVEGLTIALAVASAFAVITWMNYMAVMASLK